MKVEWLRMVSAKSVLLPLMCAAVLLAILVQADHPYPEGSTVIQISDDKSLPGVWKKKVMWKPRWIQEWKQVKVWKAYWKKVWGPVQIQEWVPIARPPPHWSSHKEEPVDWTHHQAEPIPDFADRKELTEGRME